MRQWMVQHMKAAFEDIWPIDQEACTPPPYWEGWPRGKTFALVLTHDVEVEGGHEKCRELMRMEMLLGFRSSFNFVPERYRVSAALREELTNNGFEVGVHGLKHDGKLYNSRREFNRRAAKINLYLKEWDAVGFRSPAMHHNLEWIHNLNIEYDSSTFDTDPFEPQPDGVQTIFPFLVKGNSSQKRYVELPYTLAQDFTLFILMKERCIDIWKRKLDWIAEKGGMALLPAHPDYMNFQGNELRMDEYPAKYYQNFLEYVKTKYSGQYWNGLPKEIGRFWSMRV